MEPTTRASRVPSDPLTTNVYSPSCASITSFIRRSAGITPTPQMAQSSALPSVISRSRYISSCARWNPPTPKCTIPVPSLLRSYVGVGRRSRSDGNASVLSGIGFSFPPFAGQLLDRTERQALHQLVLGGEPGDEYRQGDDHRGGAHLGQEQALAGNEAGQVHRRGLRPGRREYPGEQQLVPAEDEADQRGGGDARHDHRRDDPSQGTNQAGTVHRGGLQHLHRYLGEER